MKMSKMMILFILISLRCLEAVVVDSYDSYYMPSAPKEQVDEFIQNNPIEGKIPRKSKQNDLDIEYATHKPLYKYGYSVFDPYTLDVKSQWEHRDGDVVRGAYNMLEADGSLRIVEYSSDKDTGFRAIVKKIPFYMDKSNSLDELSQLMKNQESSSPLNQQNTQNYSPPENYQTNNHYQPNNYNSDEVRTNYNQQQLYHQTENRFGGNYYNKKEYQKKQSKKIAPLRVSRELVPQRFL